MGTPKCLVTLVAILLLASLPSISHGSCEAESNSSLAISPIRRIALTTALRQAPQGALVCSCTCVITPPADLCAGTRAGLCKVTSCKIGKKKGKRCCTKGKPLSPKKTYNFNMKVVKRLMVLFLRNLGRTCAKNFVIFKVADNCVEISFNLVRCAITETLIRQSYNYLKNSPDFDRVIYDEEDLNLSYDSRSTSAPLKLEFLYKPSEKYALNPSRPRRYNGQVTTSVCVTFFVSKKFGCAIARFAINGNTFCLFITLPPGCSAPITIFRDAYESLKNTPNFADIFEDEPDLTYVPIGTSTLKLQFITSVSPTALNNALSYAVNGQIATGICVRFFIANGFGCASASFVITGNVFCLVIRIPSSCRVPLSTFGSAYAALKASTNFPSVFYDNATLTHSTGISLSNQPGSFIVPTGFVTLKLTFVYVPGTGLVLSFGQPYTYNGQVATCTCVKFFINAGFGCATARFAIRNNVFCLFIRIPAGCTVPLWVFRRAYASLTGVPNFNGVFFNNPTLTLSDNTVVSSRLSDSLIVPAGTTILKVTFIYTPGIGLVLNFSQPYAFNGQIATCVCVKFFINRNFGCATATFVISKNIFCLIITVPRGCNVPLHVFFGAYASLQKVPGFQGVFFNNPTLTNSAGDSLLGLPESTVVDPGIYTLKLTFIYIPGVGFVLNPSFPYTYNGQIATCWCVKFFVNSGVTCATATFIVSGNTFCLIIRVPKGCTVTIGVFYGAYASLQSLSGFNGVFFNQPSLNNTAGQSFLGLNPKTIVPVSDKYTLKLTYLYIPGVGYVLNTTFPYNYNGQIATCWCVKFFVNSGITCATATFVISKNTFCLFITVPKGCVVRIGVFYGAFASLQGLQGFNAVFFNQPSLTNSAGQSYLKLNPNTIVPAGNRYILKLKFLYIPGVGYILSPESSYAFNGQIATCWCVKFFFNSGVTCATATFIVSDNTFCLIITVPNGCVVKVGVFYGAYASLQGLNGFNGVFFDNPSLSNMAGKSLLGLNPNSVVPTGDKYTLKLTYLYVPGVGYILSPTVSYAFNGQVATCWCVKFFINSGITCATATFVISKNTFCLIINVPRGCVVRIDVFYGAYASLQGLSGFNKVFFNKPTLTNSAGESYLGRPSDLIVPSGDKYTLKLRFL